jgi:hypothetical protein
MMHVARKFFHSGLPAKLRQHPLLGVNTPANEIISGFSQERKSPFGIPRLSSYIRRIS